MKKFLFIFSIPFFLFQQCSNSESIERKFIAILNSQDSSQFVNLVSENYISITGKDTLDLYRSIEGFRYFRINQVQFELDSSKIEDELKITLFLTEHDAFSKGCDLIHPWKTTVTLFINNGKIYKTLWVPGRASMHLNDEILSNYFRWIESEYPVSWLKVQKLIKTSTVESELRIDSILNERIEEYCSQLE